MLAWFIFGALCFALINFLISRHYCFYYCDEISNILNQILSRKAIIDTQKNCDSRLSKLTHQANKIIEMLHQDCAKSKDENEEVKRLIADLSHQLKTPLSNILMYSDMLGSENLDEKTRSDFVKRLKSETSKMDWLLKSLFNMSRLETGAIEFETAALPIKETILQSISAVFGKAYEKKISIELNDFPDKELIHNRKWTVEAITNILENAIKYSDSGTEITISLETREIYSRIVIQDQGIGIDNSDYNNIFKRFYRGKNVEDREGAGIGLYLARLILSKEGGNITVKSNPGIGSTFYVFLQNCKN